MGTSVRNIRYDVPHSPTRVCLRGPELHRDFRTPQPGGRQVLLSDIPDLIDRHHGWS